MEPEGIGSLLLVQFVHRLIGSQSLGAHPSQAAVNSEFSYLHLWD
jgi:hypothetical protein